MKIKLKKEIVWRVVSGTLFPHVGEIWNTPVAWIGKTSPPVGLNPRYLLKNLDGTIDEFPSHAAACEAAAGKLEEIAARLFEVEVPDNYHPHPLF